VVNSIWQEFLKIMQQEVGSQMVETWLKAVTLYQWDSRENIVYLAAPNSFVKDWLKNNYYSLFELHLKRLLNVSSLKIIFSDAEHIEKNAEKKDVNELKFAPAHLISATPNKTSIAPRVEVKNIRYINSNYTFDTFVVGPSNKLAFAAAYAVTENPGNIYNPLFMYGGSGLGKTHLLHAIGNAVKANNKRSSVLYQTADRFVNEFINAIRFDKVHHFQAKYKDVDVLLIDDIQFISNKEQTQEAFFHIFNTLYDSHKQIVFSSDTYPQNINGIAERLRSRLEWGLVADIQAPSLETKVAILKKKAETSGIDLNDEVALFLASRVIANIRALEGSLIQVIAVASLTRQPITMELAKKVVIKQSQEGTPQAVDFEHIVKHVADYFSFTASDLRSNSRSKEISFARQVTMYFMKKMTSKSLQEIGLFLGRKDHSTVIYAVSKVEDAKKKDSAFSAQLLRLEEKISH
jgi:chromosomal replication initiator protein